MFTYRVDHYIRWFTFPPAITIGSYIALAVLLLLIGDAVTLWVPKLFINAQLGQGWRLASLFAAYVLLALLFGPFGFEIPGTRIRGIFFAEWKFVTFIFVDAIPLLGVYYFLLIRPSPGRLTD
jgi:hypothetical protein